MEANLKLEGEVLSVKHELTSAEEKITALQSLVEQSTKQQTSVAALSVQHRKEDNKRTSVDEIETDWPHKTTESVDHKKEIKKLKDEIQRLQQKATVTSQPELVLGEAEVTVGLCSSRKHVVLFSVLGLLLVALGVVSVVLGLAGIVYISHHGRYHL